MPLKHVRGKMDMPQLQLMVVVIISGMLVVRAQHHVDEGNLQNALLTSYKTDVRSDTSVNVTVTPVPLSLNSLDIREQSMSVTAVYVMKWTDSRLSWNSSTYGKIDDFVVPPEKIWTPSVVVENAVTGVGKIGGASQDNTPLRIQSTGQVTWYPPLETTTSCEMKISRYPFDTQTCFITFTSWGFSSAEVTLDYASTNWSYYSANGEWDLLNSWITTGSFFDGLDYYTRMNMHFTFRRKWQFYSQNLILPICLTSILTCFLFVLPIDSGEKMGYALTVLLSYVVFLTWVTDTVPSISNDTSVLQIYLAIVLVLGVMATVLTCWVVHIHFRPATTPMSAPMRFMVTRVLLPLWNFTCCSKRDKTIQVRPADTPLQQKSDLNSSPKSSKQGFAMEAKKASADSVKTTEAVALDLEKAEELPSWPEVAAMFDVFFFMMYMMVKPILTIVMLIILYQDY